MLLARMVDRLAGGVIPVSEVCLADQDLKLPQNLNLLWRKKKYSKAVPMDGVIHVSEVYLRDLWLHQEVVQEEPQGAAQGCTLEVVQLQPPTQWILT